MSEVPAPAAPVPAAAGASPATASLYVGDLNPDVTEHVLFEKFSVVGPVQSIRVCRDNISRRSLGYAYVNFVNAADAERALDTMNFELVSGRPIRIMWSQRDPSVRRSGVGNIFIKNLSKAIDNKALYDTFSSFGDILSCKVVTDVNGESRGFGFVHFATAEAAQQAIEQVNGKLMGYEEDGRPVYVGPFKTRSERLDEYRRMGQNFKNVYVKNLPPTVLDNELTKLFEKFGKITSVKVMTKRDGDVEKSRGFGFVAFEEPEAAHAAVEALNDSELEGRKLYVGRAQKKAERLNELRRVFEEKRAERQSKYKGVNLYIKNLDDDVTDDKLRQMFEEYGTITSAKVMRDERDKSKGFGFVCFSNEEEATKAVTDKNGKLVGTKPLYVARHVRKQERYEMINQQRQQRMQQFRTAGVPMPMYGMPYMPRAYYNAPMQRPGRFQNQMMPQQFVRAPMMPHQQPRMPRAQPKQRGPIDISQLADMPPTDAKNKIGELLYHKIQSKQHANPGKITGMLLEIDNAELIHLLEDDVALAAKIQEADRVLQEHSS